MGRIRRAIFNFWHYQQWLVFFRPPILFLLLASAIIMYFGLFEAQNTKIGRFKWIVSQALGVKSSDIAYIGDGWLSFPIQRSTPIDVQKEKSTYTFNPFLWLFSSDAGVFKRQGVKPYKYTITHSVVYNIHGDVWASGSGGWRHGKIYGKELKWDVPLKAGPVKVESHEISAKGKKLRLIDK
jgi:hypothetical protein